MLGYICKSKFNQTVDAIMKRLPSTKNVSSAIYSWKTPNRLPVTLVIPSDMDEYFALPELQLAFDAVDWLLLSYCSI